MCDVGVTRKVSERNAIMLKTIESISEALKDPKHPFRKADFRPKKAQKSRYERRKIKEYLHLADFMEEAV